VVTLNQSKNFPEITKKIVLGTAQFGMDYGIANLSGKPSKKEMFEILDLAWGKGVRRFDTAPGYGSELILGEFISANGLQNEVKVLTKIPHVENHLDYENALKISTASSLKKLGCPIDVLFFHNPMDSGLLKKHPLFFENLLCEFQVSTLGVSVYEPQEVDDLLDSPFELAFQFPFNVLDRRFEKVNMPQGKRYSRSIFLQGLLASPNGLRMDAPEELLILQKEFHKKLASLDVRPVDFAIYSVVNNKIIDYFLVGVDSVNQIKHILNTENIKQQVTKLLDEYTFNIDKNLLDPRKWN
jgi:aryl-alcohol dehydrogenase-like predicted oxidoreductase